MAAASPEFEPMSAVRFAALIVAGNRKNGQSFAAARGAKRRRR
jgi:hypothetical protein